jgi:hypothetical protein
MFRTEAWTRSVQVLSVRYNERVPKRICPSRAEWRLQPGRPAEALSPHYRLDCDYGTVVITSWEDGGSEPIYVCESHAKQLGRPRKVSSDIRVITLESDISHDPAKVEERTEIPEVAVPRPEISASLTLELDHSNDPVKVEEPTEMQEVAAPEPKRSPSPEPVGSLPVPDAFTPSQAARSPAETKVARAAGSSVRSSVRDLTYGNPAKAMVDEAIWNLATGNYEAYKTARQEGKSAAEAAEAAGGQLAVVHRKISDYTSKLETLLSASRAKINVAEAIDKPLEHAVLEIIGNGATSDSEKDAAIQQLGTLQEWAKQGLQGDITPLQANRIALAIGDRLNWGGTADVREEFKLVYRALYGNLKTAIRAAVPEAQNLHDRLANLYAAKSDLEIR